MKHSKTFKLIIFLGLFFICKMATTENTKVGESSESPCEDPCSECQRVVYQMKFQAIADCGSSGVCKNTCSKIRDNWNSPFNPYEPFLKDMFGKCEICFRNGFCTISQCKEQERNEIEVINSVVNGSHLTAKISEDLLVSYPENGELNALPKIVKLNPKVQTSLKKELKVAVKIRSADNLISKVQNLVKNYFDKPSAAVHGNAYNVLNVVPLQPSSAANISYWAGNDVKNSANIEKTKSAVLKLDKHIQNIKDLKEHAKSTKGEEKKATVKLIKKEQKELNKLVKRTENLNKVLAKKEKSIQKLIVNPKVQDANLKSALTNSLNQFQQYRTAINSVKSQIKDEKRKLIANKH